VCVWKSFWACECVHKTQNMSISQPPTNFFMSAAVLHCKAVGLLNNINYKGKYNL